MTTRRSQSQMAPEEVVEHLRSLLAQHETTRNIPPPFEPIEGEPEPWSCPPPGGFDQLRESLRKTG